MTDDLRLGDRDLFLFNEGTHQQLHEKMGGRLGVLDGIAGAHFAVWAPNASSVSVVGDFNGWPLDPKRESPLALRGQSGIWEGFIPGLKKGTVYQFRIRSAKANYQEDKADPYALTAEVAPKTGSVLWDLDYEWQDPAWMNNRAGRNSLSAPMSIYEVHLGSWMRVPEQGYRSLTYREIAPKLAAHVRSLGFTHVELMPLMEHPFFGSWGYQVTGYFAPTSRYGTPQDLMYLIDCLHQEELGVIFDWVPAHFPTDAHGLINFDGTHLYEHADLRQGFHPEWNSAIFNYGRKEVASFLLSSALFWLERYHADGLRVDGVASMLYLDYGRKEGQWIPNKFGGRENLEAVAFLRQLNDAVTARDPDVRTIAEESTSWPLVSRPTYTGGLGFSLKWDLGWMHDTLDYLAQDPIYRRYHHNKLTFRQLYAYKENFVLPLSHDEVVYGKGSLIGKMVGDDWQKFASLRLLFAYQFTQPGKKLLFMGGEFAQWREWNHDGSLDWHLLKELPHQQIALLVGELNRLYRARPALHQFDTEAQGFSWVEADNAEYSVIAYERRAGPEIEPVLALFNFTPVPRNNYRIGVDRGGVWKEILNTDATLFGGSGQGNGGAVEAAPVGWHGRRYSLNLVVPPLGALLLSPARAAMESNAIAERG